MEIKVLNTQTLFDVALQAAGSVEAAFDIAAAAGGSITDELPAGKLLSVPAVVNKQAAEFYRVHAIRPATDLSVADATLMLAGIGFWTVGYNFMVS